MPEENGILDKIREIVRNEIKLAFEAMADAKLDKKVEGLVDQLVQVVVEHALEKQGPDLVAAELHKALTGEPKKKNRSEDSEEDPSAAAFDAGGSPKSKAPKKRTKSAKPGKRPRCRKCGSAQRRTKDGKGYECRKCGR
ncbi:MAG TPA: hypothetical protein DCM05_09080 [Elusimicrobia bacterium]|nr:hypothetical protein [Elusimicrobiota bacterium]